MTSEASWWPLGESERAESSESISSNTMTDGASSSAAAKTFRISFSDSPYHFDATTARVNEMKCASDSAASARQISVLPVPGGPYSSTPVHGFARLPRLKSSGRRSGSSTCSSGVQCSGVSGRWRGAPEGRGSDV